MSHHYPAPILHGKTVLVTGGSSGIGRACVAQFLAEGCHVIATGRNTDKLKTLHDLHGANAHTLKTATLDVTDRKAVEHFCAQLDQAPDILVNSAGLALGREVAQEALMDDWQVMVDTNISGMLYITHALLPRMVVRGRGHIINLGSIAGDYPYPGGNVYGASKAFVKQFSLNLRADLLGTPLRVTNIEPGMVQTPFSDVRFKGDHAKAAQVYEGADPLTADDIANSIAWVAGLPEHVNINRMEIMPVCQASQALLIDRKAAAKKSKHPS